MAWPAIGAPEALTGTLAKIEDAGVIVIGYREAEPPFSFQKSDGTVVGFSIDLCMRIVERVREQLGRDDIVVEYVVATPATRFILVKNGMIDLECAATTNNAERRELVDYSYPHFMTATHFVSRRADNIESVADLAGRSVASASGTVNIDQLNALNRAQNLNIAVMPTKSNEDAFDLVVTGRASAFVMDGILLAAMVAETPDPSIYVLSTDTLSRPEPYGLLLKHGDTAFKTLVNETLESIYTSGDIDAIYAKWFTSPIPPRGTNLNLPLSSDLAAAFRTPVEYLE
ncbi:amino acid ABC transporter substrate-binding protein [Devosia sp.]|uniref:amino acid ABC transporter substrate-binding protein n=1 Tax=Devosia sp. TaxID=1871048 RepID=UPI003FA53807